MPAKLEKCVTEVKAEGKSESSAFAICNSNNKTAQRIAHMTVNSNLLTAQINFNNYSRSLTAKKKLV